MRPATFDRITGHGTKGISEIARLIQLLTLFAKGAWPNFATKISFNECDGPRKQKAERDNSEYDTT